MASSGISLRLWRLYAQAWLICLLFPILALIHLQLALVDLLLTVTGLVIFVASYTWVMWPHPLHRVARSRLRARMAQALLIGLTALALVFSLAYGSAFMWLLVGVSAMVGVLLPARSAFLAVMILTLLTLGASVVIAGGVIAADWLHIIPLVLLVRGLGLDMAGVVRLADALREVHTARRELARLAVLEERLRVARDLHDLLGQSLSLITLKSELARRLIAQDPGRAAQEIEAVERAARQTLRDVRAAVAGYRQPSLASELAGARQVLEAAGISCAVEHTAEAMPPAIDALLGWTVREGVTNVVRHSRARWCRIAIRSAQGSVWIEVSNDGAPGQERETTRGPAGTGLAGLSERVVGAGGRIVAGPAQVDGANFFRLQVELPAVERRAR